MGKPFLLLRPGSFLIQRRLRGTTGRRAELSARALGAAVEGGCWVELLSEPRNVTHGREGDLQLGAFTQRDSSNRERAVLQEGDKVRNGKKNCSCHLHQIYCVVIYKAMLVLFPLKAYRLLSLLWKHLNRQKCDQCTVKTNFPVSSEKKAPRTEVTLKNYGMSSAMFEQRFAAHCGNNKLCLRSQSCLQTRKTGLYGTNDHFITHTGLFCFTARH